MNVQTMTIAAVMLLIVISALLSFELILAKKKIREMEKNMSIDQEREEMSRSHAIAELLYDNVLEADITHDVLIGSNCKKLIAMLELPEDASFSACIEEVVQKFVKEEYHTLYYNSFNRENLLNRYAMGEHRFSFEFVEKSDLVNYCWTRVTVCIYYSDVSKAVKIVSYVKNIQEEKEKELNLIRDASTDYLTGLYNRHAVEKMICNAIEQNNRLSVNHALIIADIDNFKLINDAIGHAAGDKVLRMVADILKAQFSNGGIVGRIGGDEFLILIENCKNKEEVIHKLRELTDRIAEQNMKECMYITLSLSIGAALYPLQADSYNDLFAIADAALYHVKRNGRNGYYMYNDPKETHEIIRSGEMVLHELM